ncbi:MAG: CPBP family intramembrane glutamic endopeptidase [Lapillicoccus sp.]
MTAAHRPAGPHPAGGHPSAGHPPGGHPAERLWAAARERLIDVLPKPMADQVPPIYEESDATRTRRRRIVSAFGVAGAGLLGLSLATEPGSRRFYVLTSALAATWTAGAIASGPLHLGWISTLGDSTRRPVLTPIGTGALAFGAFYGAALVAREIPFLAGAIGNVLRYADQGSIPLVALTTCTNGIAEELFFRGALYSVVRDEHPVLTSTLAYTAATAATRNPALVLAGGVMGALFGLQRRASGGIQAPALTHLTWSILMLRFLPPLFRKAIRNETHA